MGAEQDGGIEQAMGHERVEGNDDTTLDCTRSLNAGEIPHISTCSEPQSGAHGFRFCVHSLLGRDSVCSTTEIQVLCPTRVGMNFERMLECRLCK